MVEDSLRGLCSGNTGVDVHLAKLGKVWYITGISVKCADGW